jgi:peptide methionine sulfoxide reductase MsrB
MNGVLIGEGIWPQSLALRSFRSDTKFETGTGWPSLFNLLPGTTMLHEESDLTMKRLEVR